MSSEPPRSDTKASFEPSGDQYVWLTVPAFGRIVRLAPPASGTLVRSNTPPPRLMLTSTSPWLETLNQEASRESGVSCRSAPSERAWAHIVWLVFPVV